MKLKVIAENNATGIADNSKGNREVDLEGSPGIVRVLDYLIIKNRCLDSDTVAQCLKAPYSSAVYRDGDGWFLDKSSDIYWKEVVIPALKQLGLAVEIV